MTHMKRLLIGIIGAIVAICIAGIAAIYYLPNTFTETNDTQVLIVEENETGAEIAQNLYEKGLIISPEVFRVALRVTGAVNTLQSGYYQIPEQISMYDLIQLLQEGRLKTVRVTIPEGYTIGEIGIELERQQLVTSQEFLDEAKDFVPYQYMYGPKKVSYRTEGFLFPSTYDIPVNATAKDILKMMATEMNRQITPSVQEQLKKDNMTIFEFITLASLVEKEARFDEDRGIIAAVFKKRIKEHMPIQSDATISYILGYAKDHVTLNDIKLESPYNTYLHAGYPPGPIANPGKKSLEAVLYAPETEYLYFVADKEGHNHFSKTYEEHLKVVESIYGDQ